MAITFDVILLGVFVFLTVRGCLRGLVKSVLSLGRLLLSLLFTVLFGSLVGDWLKDTFDWPFTAVLGYVLLFVALYVGLTLLIKLVGKITKLPVVRQCDKLLGGLLGALQGWVAVSLLAVVMYAVLYLGGDMTAYNDSVIFSTVHELNIFEFLIDHLI